MANPKWFDVDVYLANKLAQLQKAEPTAGWTAQKLADAFASAGFVGAEGAYKHFEAFGAAENLSPNAFFDAEQYFYAKAAQLNKISVSAVKEYQVAEVKDAIKKAGMNAWTHYDLYGSFEGVNPSNSFDEAAYLAAKLADLKVKDAANWPATKTVDDVKAAFKAAGLSALEHYLEYGKTEAFVAADKLVVADTNKVPTTTANAGQSFTLTASADTIIEGTSATFTVTRTGDLTAAKSLTFNTAGNTNGDTVAAATAGTDCTPASGTVTFAAGSATATFTVSANTDSATEGLEGLKVNLFDGTTVVGTKTVLLNDDPNAPVSGQTYTLTNGVDNITGTANNDIIIGDNSGAAASNTVTAGDQINGGAGTDTFKYYGAAATVVMPQLSNVENLILIAPTATTALDVSANTTLTSVAIQDLAGTIAGVKLNANQTMTLDNVTGGNNATIDYGSTATAATLKVANGVAAGTVNMDGTAIKTLNINSTGKANTIATLASSGTEATVNFTGDQKVTVTNALNASVKTIDASGMTAGGAVVTAGNADVKFTGGAGADTIKFAAGQFDTFDVIDGGAGVDTLSLADTGAPSANLLKAINAVKNVETVAFSGGGATVDASLITNGATSYQIDTTAGNFALTNVTSAGTVTYSALDNSASTDSISNKLGDLTSNVTLTASAGSAAKTGAMTLSGINTVNLKSDFTGTGSQATANAFGTTGAGNAGNTKFVVTGTQDLVLAKLAATTTGSTVDAAAFTGKLTATGSGKADAITGGSGADTLGGGDITGNPDGTKEVNTITVTTTGATDKYDVTVAGVTVTTGVLGDTTTTAATAIAAALTGNATIAALVDVTTATNVVTITWKTAGAKTDASLTLSTGTTAVAAVTKTDGTNPSAGTGAAAADVLTGGAGADTFKFLGLQESAYAADASTVDTIKDFVAGTDKLDISGIVHDITNSATAATVTYVYQSGALVAQSTVQASVNAASPSTLAAAVTAAATQITADKVGAFQYGGDTYVFLNNHTAGVGTADGLIKLTGTVTLGATDFVFHA